MAAIQEAEKILAGDGRVEELKKQVESVRAAARQREQQRADVERALDESAKMTNDNEAIARLQRELGKYPGNAAITNAIGERTKARDTLIADLVRIAQRAPDAQAVTLLQEALTFDSSRLDVRRELERRRASLWPRARRHHGHAMRSRRTSGARSMRINRHTPAGASMLS